MMMMMLLLLLMLCFTTCSLPILFIPNVLFPQYDESRRPAAPDKVLTQEYYVKDPRSPMSSFENSALFFRFATTHR